MRHLFSLSFIIAVLFATALPSLAQTNAEPASADELRITWKEVSAVQTELSHRGYYQGEINGVLDRETRAALREFQSRNELPVSGRIDRATIDKLGLLYPATGQERDSRRRNGAVAKVGYAIKDGVTDTGKAVGGAARSVGRRARTVAEKTADATTGAVNKTRELANDTGDATAKGAKTVGADAHRATRRVSNVLVGRSDAELSREVRDVLSGDPQTASVKSEVKSGAVTLTLPPESQTDLSAAITRIRQIHGVESVMVVYQ